MKPKGQAAVETMFSIVFITSIFFATMQFIVVAITWLNANEAAQASVRSAVLEKGSMAEGAEGSSPEMQAQITAARKMRIRHITTVWDRPPGESAGYDHSSGNNGCGADIMMFSAHIYYFQKLGFSRLFGSLSNFGMLSISNKYGPSGAAHCRMVKSPDWRYYEKAYPGAYNFND